MSTNAGERVFTSWKEIASFFGKGVRTVQRWERKFGLPISRPTAAKNVVLANESDLREWIHRASSPLAVVDRPKGFEQPNNHGDEAMVQFAARLKRLEEETAHLASIVSSFSTRIDELAAKISERRGASRLAPPNAGLLKTPVKPVNFSRK